MKIPMMDVAAQNAELGDELERAVVRVVRGGKYIMGPEVGELEGAMSAALGVRPAIGVSSGTDALLVALMALDVGPGDLVLTTTYSFFATAGVVARLGARPVLLDVDAATCNLDPSAVEAWLDEHPDDRARVRAIVPVHLFGQCADMGRILRAAAAHGIPVVEDAAQAIGATWPGDGDGAAARRAGTMGRVGCFSFHPTKNLGALGDAGMVVTSDAQLAARMRRLRQHGAEPKYVHAEIGGNFRLDTIQAAALAVKLPRLERWSALRRARAARYDEALAPVAGVEPLACAWGRAHHVYNQYVVRVRRPGARDALRAHLEARGVATQVFYPVPFHLQACFRHLGLGAGALPRAEAAAAETLALPIYPELTDAQQDHVIAAIRDHATAP